MGIVAFVIALCYHTPLYIGRWIYPALVFYGLDLFMRMLRARVKDAVLVPINKQMTLVSFASSMLACLGTNILVDQYPRLHRWLGCRAAPSRSSLLLWKSL